MAMGNAGIAPDSRTGRKNKSERNQGPLQLLSCPKLP
jgi:hypothetical protein